ncbi:MAG: glycosyltransferase family 2 protein, partial [Planctomycetaceae bacterium]
ENAKFLDEWISHHLGLGVDLIILYDNSASRYDDTFGAPLPDIRFDGVSINKHNVNYAEKLGKWADRDQVSAEIFRLLEKYGDALQVIKWERKNELGVIAYFQKEAVRDFVLRFVGRIDYCVAIDTDEFLISDRDWSIHDLVHSMEERGLGSVLLGQRRFLYRFASLDTTVREIPWCLKEDAQSADYSAGKCVFSLRQFTGFSEPFYIHAIPSLTGMGKVDHRDMRFHHYGWPSFRDRASLADFSSEELKFLESRFVRDESMFRYLTNASQGSDSGRVEA